MNVNSLKIWDHGAGDESVDNKIMIGAEIGGLLPGLEFALKSAINFSEWSNKSKTCHLFVLSFPAERGLSIK